MDNTHWHFYIRTDDTWRALKEAFINARKTIDIEEYIFELDEIGHEFIELLVKKRKEGVKIRILCDMAGSYGFYTSSLPEILRNIGIEVRFFNVIKPWRIRSFFSWFFRDHRKLIVVDDHLGFIGGVNIRSDMRNWRDTHLKMSGPIIREMRYAFQEMWVTSGEKKFFKRMSSTRQFIRGFQFVTNSPYIRKRFLYKELVRAIRDAREYIYLTTPYFVPDRRLRRILRMASMRGVDVKILVPKTSNYLLVDLGSASYFEKLLASGIKIFHYDGELLHAKTAVIDDAWATVGSFNLDSLSFVYNYEANIVSTKEKFALEVKQYFEDDVASSKEITLEEWKGRSMKKKFLEKLTFPIRRFL